MLREREERVAGGVGLIITGLMMAAKADKTVPEGESAYSARIIDGIEKLADVVHRADSGCKIVGRLAKLDSMQPLQHIQPHLKAQKSAPSQKRRYALSKDFVSERAPCVRIVVATSSASTTIFSSTGHVQGN